MWSWSSWLSTIQRTSAGSTTEKACAAHSSRTSDAPVSTRTGSAPRITMLWAPTNVPDGSAAIVGITKVSSVTAYGEVGRVIGCIGRLPWLDLVGPHIHYSEP